MAQCLPNLTHFLTLSQHRHPPSFLLHHPEHALSCSEPLYPEDLWMFPSSSCSNSYLTAPWGQCFLFSQGVAVFSRILSILGSGETECIFFSCSPCSFRPFLLSKLPAPLKHLSLHLPLPYFPVVPLYSWLTFSFFIITPDVILSEGTSFCPTPGLFNPASNYLYFYLNLASSSPGHILERVMTSN